MKIRKVTRQDIEVLTELKMPKKESHRQQFYNNQLKRIAEMQEHRSIYLLAEDGNKILGQVYIRFSGKLSEPDFPNIQDLYVLPFRRNQGIGTTLLKAAEEAIKKAGYTKVSIAVNPTLNPKAKALYERLGYKKTNSEPYLDGIYDGDEDWVIDMVKLL